MLGGAAGKVSGGRGIQGPVCDPAHCGSDVLGGG